MYIAYTNQYTSCQLNARCKNKQDPMGLGASLERIPFRSPYPSLWGGVIERGGVDFVNKRFFEGCAAGVCASSSESGQVARVLAPL